MQIVSEAKQSLNTVLRDDRHRERSEAIHTIQLEKRFSYFGTPQKKDRPFLRGLSKK
jgi:hypothetical protein